MAFHQGEELAFSLNTDGEGVGVYQKPSSGNGQAELLMKTSNFEFSDWSSDGRYLAGSGGRSPIEFDGVGAADIWSCR